MARIDPLPEDRHADIQDVIEFWEKDGQDPPNCFLTLGRRPEIARAMKDLIGSLRVNSTIPPQLRNMVYQVASRSAGCVYCSTHTAALSPGMGTAAEKEAALWDWPTSPLFSDAERAALRVAQGAAQVPNAVTDEDFAELKKHYSDEQIVDIVAAISVFGFLNRFNDTMATDLEPSRIWAGQYLDHPNWTGKKPQVGSS